MRHLMGTIILSIFIGFFQNCGNTGFESKTNPFNKKSGNGGIYTGMDPVKDNYSGIELIGVGNNDGLGGPVNHCHHCVGRDYICFSKSLPDDLSDKEAQLRVDVWAVRRSYVLDFYLLETEEDFHQYMSQSKNLGVSSSKTVEGILHLSSNQFDLYINTEDLANSSLRAMINDVDLDIELDCSLR